MAAAAGGSPGSSAADALSPKTYPLRDVVSECERRWFVSTLKAAQVGDVAMQLLVGEMYCNGYGVARNVAKVLLCPGVFSFCWDLARIFLQKLLYDVFPPHACLKPWVVMQGKYWLRKAGVTDRGMGHSQIGLSGKYA